MFQMLGSLFFICLGLASCAAAVFFLLFTCMVSAMLVGSWTDQEFTLKDRFAITALFSLVITWGGFLTYMSATYGWAWMHG